MKTKAFPLKLMAMLAILITPACTDEETTGESTQTPPPDITGGTVELASTGEQANVTIPISTPWEASSSADWLQLSQMGGKGGETVQVIAARNVTGQDRTGYIRFSDTPGTKSAADSTEIVVHQPADETASPGVVLTEAYYSDGNVYVKIYNGRESSSSMQQLDIVAGSDFSFTDPDALYPGKAPIVYIGQGEDYLANPYVLLDGNGMAEGKFSIAGEPSVNTLRVKQNIVCTEMGQLGNEGSATLHFTDGSTIYYGGGIVKDTDLGLGEHVYSTEFRSYDTATGEEKQYADIPDTGAGFCWDGAPFIIGESAVYRLSDDEWSVVTSRSGAVLAAAIDGNEVYAVTPDAVQTYVLDTDDNGVVTMSETASAPHGVYFNDVKVTTDDDGATWLLDDMSHAAHRVADGSLETFDCQPADTLGTTFQFIGVCGGCIYAFNDETVTRYAIGDENPEPLKMLGGFEWYGETECVNGVLYNFGGTTSFRGTATASHELRRFVPSDYVPISVAIMPE